MTMKTWLVAIQPPGQELYMVKLKAITVKACLELINRELHAYIVSLVSHV